MSTSSTANISAQASADAGSPPESPISPNDPTSPDAAAVVPESKPKKNPLSSLEMLRKRMANNSRPTGGNVDEEPEFLQIGRKKKEKKETGEDGGSAEGEVSKKENTTAAAAARLKKKKMFGGIGVGAFLAILLIAAGIFFGVKQKSSTKATVAQARRLFAIEEMNISSKKEETEQEYDSFTDILRNE